MKIPIEALKLAIHQTHDCDAKRLLATCKVEPDAASADTAPAEVYLFEIEGHPVATECFAWVVEIDEKRVEIPAVLRSRRVLNAEMAVRSVRPRKQQPSG